MKKFISIKSSIFFILISISNISPLKSEDRYGDYLNHKYYNFLNSSSKSIIELVDNSEKVIYIPKENTPYCKTGNFWGYLTHAEKGYDGDYLSILGMCTNTILRFGNNFTDRRYYISETMNHEAFHAAQLCRSPSTDFLPFGLQNGRFSTEIENHVSENYKGISYMRKLVEMEAFYAEQKPYLVMNYLKKYCY